MLQLLVSKVRAIHALEAEEGNDQQSHSHGASLLPLTVFNAHLADSLIPPKLEPRQVLGERLCNIVALDPVCKALSLNFILSLLHSHSG